MVIELPLFDRFTLLRSLAHRIHHFAPTLAIIGLSLSLLHQSSLGGTYGVVIGRAALFRATMPLLFIVSAIAAGMAFTVHMTLLVQWVGKRRLVPNAVLFEVGQIGRRGAAGLPVHALLGYDRRELRLRAGTHRGRHRADERPVRRLVLGVGDDPRRGGRRRPADSRPRSARASCC